MTRLKGCLVAFAAMVCLSGAAFGGDIDRKDLLIAGLSLEVDTATVVTNTGIPAAVQTKFGGKINDDAPPDNGLTAVGELSGPGIDTPIRLVTKPGHLFQLPILNERGDYILRNIRLLSADGKVLQTAAPSFANITITQVLDTKISVRQLTPDDLRARGITVDANNYDVYEYTFVFAINGQTVSVPYPVLVDKRTHEILKAPSPDPYGLPALPVHQTPPRFQPPVTIPFFIDSFGGDPGVPAADDDKQPHRVIPAIPAAIVVSSGLGVLHQFFAVILNVGNNAPAGSAVTIDSITATLDAPLGLRLAKTTPAVTIGQAVPVVDEKTGAQFLVAAAQGSAEWSLEAVKAGTHTIAVNVRATYKAPNQPDTTLKGALSASFVVSDPRFQINFVHPETVRGGEEYTAYAFITNTSATAQTVRIDPGSIPVCGGDSSFSNFNVCFPQAMDPVEATIDRGKTLTVPYHLKSRLTGSVFAFAGAADDNIKVGVSLSLGVSASGIPLSPATLLMPFYTRYVDPDFVAAQMTLFGLGYSLATAPLNDRTALLPRVIPNDVFRRAQDVARAGERIFIRRAAPDVPQPLDDRDPLFDLSLDLLGNVEQIDRLPFTPDLKEWDELRRSEDSGRGAAAAMSRQLERVGLAAGKSASDFANDFAASTAHRSPYLLAIVHGATVNGNARPYAMTITGKTSHSVLAVPSEGAQRLLRALPFAELTQFRIPNEYGELGMVGRFSESIQIDVVPASSDFFVELIYPATTDGSMLRASFHVTNASSSGVSFVIDRGLTNILLSGGTYVPVSGPSVVLPPALAISGAAQDLHLNGEGRTVSLLLNRPITVADPSAIRDLITLTTDVASIGYHSRKRNTGTKVFIPGAALQADGRILDVHFDKTLSKNAIYTIAVDDVLVPGGVVHPRIDIATPAGLLYGKVLAGDNTTIADAPVTLTTQRLTQYDRTLDGSITGDANDTGRYLFEYIPRDDNNGLPGTFTAQTFTTNASLQVSGVIRSPGEMQQLNLVFIGRGSVTGFAKYSDGRPLVAATVVAGSAGYNNPLLSEMKTTKSGIDGSFTIADLPVGPFTLSVSDAAGNVTFAANQIHSPGESLRQDLIVRLRPFPGTGTVRVTVRRSDISASDPHSLVAGAHVGVFSEGYGLVDGFTDGNGRAEFTRIPAGPISLLAADFDITQQSAGVEVDLAPDSTVDQTLTLNVPNAADLAARATLNGTVFRDDPFNPTNLTPVAGAIVTINGFASVTAGPDGKFTYEGIPLALAGKKVVTAFDPSTRRAAGFSLPTPLVAGANAITLVISSTQPGGLGTMRVRLFDSGGRLVSGYRVLIPGFPSTDFKELIDTPGIYELTGVAVPRSDTVFAVPNGTNVQSNAQYGDQIASGRVALDFVGQTAVLDLRLPGQGNVIAHLGCAQGVTNCNLDVHAPVTITYRVWDSSVQDLTPQDRKVSPDANGVLLINRVPVDQPAIVATFENPLGYASAPVELQFEGQQKDVFLTLTTTSSISGRVLNWDRQTPIAGALVHLEGGAADLGSFPTAEDGTFRIDGVAANQQIRVIAEHSIDGIFRTGSIDTRTPLHGGPDANLVVILQEQASVEGTIVDGNGVAVPLARYWARELAWPYQTHGSFSSPLSADRNGHFIINNVFQGGIHISAQSPLFQEQRGEFQGTIAGEANDLTGVQIVVGAGGTGTISVTVFDGASRVANAEATLVRGNSTFDFGQSDGNGVVTFDNVPVGSDYTVRVISRARARTGTNGVLTVSQGALTSVDIGLSVLGVVTGSLVDTETSPERPIAGGHITLTSGSITTRTTTDAAGNFRFDGVPEGHFTVSGYDFDSGRSTTPSPDFVLTSTIQELDGIKLTLEPTASLNVQVFLPNDAGGPGVPAPLVDVTVSQDSGYHREQQGPGSGITFPKLLAIGRYSITAGELGGEERSVSGTGTFAPGANSGTIGLTFATSGTVQVTVVSDDPNAASIIASAKVTISASGNSLVIFPDASGNIIATGVPLGSVSASAVSQGLSAVASGTLNSRSVPLHLTLTLGRRITMAGHVEAEAGVGQPSVNTRVLVQITSNAAAGVINIEAHTDTLGNYSITGVPVGNTSVHFDFYGPDGVSRGATRTVAVPDGTVDSYPAPNVKLDATGPRVVSIDPPGNSNSVAPNSPVTITFTEPLDPATVNGGNFRLIASDDSQAAPLVINIDTAGGQYRVRLSPVGLLKSNMTYTVSIRDTIADVSGNKMTLAVTTTFTTVDYTEPRVVSTTPTIDQAVGDGTTFYLRFNKPIDASVFASGTGLLKLEQLASNHGAVTGSPLPVSIFADPQSASTIVVAPTGVALQPASFYRISVNGARDTLTPPNVQTTLQTFDFFSADHVRPVVTIDAPSASTKLVSGVDYVATVAIVDEGTAPPHASTDISYVQWFDANSKPLARVTTAPYGYAVRIASGVTSLTLKASAVDLSGNVSDIASQTWEVTPNLPPQNIAITVQQSTYVARSVALAAAFDEDGLVVTSALAVTGKHRDGTPYVLDAAHIHRLSAQPIRRTTISDPWPSVQYTIDAPSDLKEDDALQFSLTLTDADNQSSSKSASVSVLVDATPPHITATSPAGETHYKFGDATRNHYRAQVSVTDPESGVAHVTFLIDGKSTDVKFSDAGASYDGNTYTFFTDVDVTAKNVDTRIHITATAYDYDGNHDAQTTDVIYDSVNDGTAPMMWWLTPLDGALVAKGNVTLTLRVRATDDIHVDSVTFDSLNFATITADRLANNVFEKSVTFATPADGSSFTINATASDSGHQTIVPITIDQIVPDVDLATDAQVNSGNVATYAGKTVRVHGSGKKLYISVPVTLQNLIVADGATVGNPDGTKIDLTVRDRLYVDGDSSIDVTGKGYLGGWASHESGGQNASPNGVTAGNSTISGAAPAASGSFFASGSYGGLGGSDAGAATNATYGSITNPADFGSGGSGSFACCTAGGNGGGAVVIAGGSGANDLSRFVIAGDIRADGLSGIGAAGAGSGGSINLHARALVAGWASRITANGGDDDGAVNTSRGGGGGRIALSINDRWDVEPTQPLMQTRGGRNDNAAEARASVDGGAGTLFVQKPGVANGELIVSAFDERHPASLHLTRATPLAKSAGTLVFDSIAAGPRSLARFDDDYTTDPPKVSVDSTAVLLRSTDQPSVTIASAPPAGTSLIQAGTLSLTYNAQSAAGVGEVHVTLGTATESSLPSFDYPASIAPTATTLAIPLNATPGSTTLKLRVTDRAGRIAETPATSYTIVANTPPALDQFDVSPASLTIYAGHPITVIAAASDDLEVKTLTLTSSIGTIAPVTPISNPATHGLGATFTVSIPPTIASGTVVALTLTATDGTGGTTAQTKNVTILHDANPPAIAITAPSAGAVIQEGSAIAVSATIVDAEVAVKQAAASIDGVSAAMTQDSLHPNVWTATLTAPEVDGTVDVPKTITVTASDFESNASPASVTINDRPIIDALAPTVTWICNTPGAMVPSGATAKLQVLAVPVAGDSINTVSMTITDPAGTRTVPMTAAGGGNYKYDYLLPAVASDAAVTLRALAATFGGKSTGLPGSLTIIAPGATVFTFAADATIASADTTYDAKTVIVTGGKLTIAGKHTFARLIVLNGASVVHAPTDAATTNRLDIAASSVFVACGASIDATARGFLPGRTWNNSTTGASVFAAGSHGGTGGIDTGFSSTSAASPYGSLYDPNEPGGGGATGSNTPFPGGGIVRIQSPVIVLDGKVNASGGGNGGSVISGAGGSVRIDTSTISGAGEIHADGGPTAYLGGGGGRVAIYYSGTNGMALSRSLVTASGGAGGSPTSRSGAAGTVYLRQLDGAGAKVSDELIVDNGAVPLSTFTTLPDLGSGTITAVNGNVLTLSGAVPDWMAGSSIEILNSAGAVIATYEIASSTETTVTVIVPNGQTLNAPIGSAYRGSTKIAAFTIAASAKLQTPALHGDDMTVSGEIDTTEVRAHNLTLKNGAVRQTATTASTTNALRIVATGTLSVDAGSVIDASSRGFLPGRTWNNSTIGASVFAGGSHGGTGGSDTGFTGASAAGPYGSLYDPNEPGGGGSTGTNTPFPGGGIVRIQSPVIVLDGKVNASGGGGGFVISGAGGSVRIDTSTISGAGEIHADGGPTTYLGGGGGRVAIYYTGTNGMALSRAFVTAAGGGAGSPVTRNGAAGTVYLRQVDGTGMKVTDELVIDNGAVALNTVTSVVDLGSGTIIAVNGNVLTLSGPVPDWVAGSSIEILNGAGDVIATYEIASSTATTVTVIVPNGQTPNAPIGSAYRGSTKIAVYTIGTNGKLQSPALRGVDITLSGEIDTTEIRAHNVTLKNAAIRQTATTASATSALRIVATGTLSVDAGSVIDATARGFLPGRTWNNSTIGASVFAGGSHGGTGGSDTGFTGASAAGPYGSLYDPNEPGGGGSTGTNTPFPGGGIVRIQSPVIVLDGKVNASGGGGGLVISGAGGSVRIDTSTISGAGEIHADGGPTAYLGGGGGRVAIYYTGTNGMALSRAFVTAAGGGAGSPVTRNGAPGTVYLKRDTQTNGELIVDNGTTTTSGQTILTSVGGGVITSVTSSTGGANDTIGDTSAAFAGPNLLSGNRVYVNVDKTILWPVRGNTATTLLLDISAAALTAQVGDPYAGLYRFDTLRLRNARVVSGDAIESLTTIDQDGVSTITTNPFIPASLASLTAQPRSVTGGGTVTFAIRTNARPSSTVITLTSTSAAVPVPASITMPAGQNTMSFSVIAGSPASETTATITANVGNSSASTTVTVIPAAPTLSSITLTPSSVQGGTNVNGTIVLGGAAPAGGASVALNSSNASLATVPAVAVVPEGSTSASFTVVTAQTGSSTVVSISGVYGSTQSATLTITPCSAMQSASTPASAPLTTVWIDDALPSGASSSGSGGLTNAQAASGTQSIGIPAATGARQFAFTGGSALTVGSGDKLVAYLLVNPCSPPRQVMLVFSDGGSADYRASWGEDLIEPTIAHTRVGTMPAGGSWIRLEVLAATIGAAGKNLTGLAIKVFDGEAWIDRVGTQICSLATVAPPASFPAIESIWFDDQLPAGAIAVPSVWSFDTTQHASGANSHVEPVGAGYHQHSFTGATDTMLVKPGDVLFAYVLVDPCNPPRQIQMSWYDGTSFNHRANWGDPSNGTLWGTAANYHIGAVPDGGVWVRLEVPAQLIGLENTTVSGAAFSVADGQAWFDRAGKYSRVNLALGKPASQSTTYDPIFSADKAVDGITDGDYSKNFGTHTTLQAQPWWQVDLGSSQPIESVELWNRSDCCADRLSAFWLFVSDTPFASSDINTTRNQSGVSSYRYEAAAGTNVMFMVNRVGRYVRVQLSATEYLALAEVQVWAPATAQRVNLAGGRSTTATQSSQFSTGAAYLAVNGTTLPNGADLSITATDSEATPWWQIDLGNSQVISSIDLFNRLDAVPERLEHFYVFVSDTPFTTQVLADAIAQPGVYVFYAGIPTTGRPAPASYSIPINRTGRYVRVQLTGTDVLTLAEVQIWPLLAQLAPLSRPFVPLTMSFDFRHAWRSQFAVVTGARK